MDGGLLQGLYGKKEWMGFTSGVRDVLSHGKKGWMEKMFILNNSRNMIKITFKYKKKRFNLVKCTMPKAEQHLTFKI